MFKYYVVSLLFFGSAALGDNLCLRGDGDAVEITLQVSERAVPVVLRVDLGYFDQRFVPRSGSRRDGLLLSMQASDFAPWPNEVRPHQSEGPFMSYLISNFLDFELIAQRYTSNTLGYRVTDDISWIDSRGPYGLLSLVAPDAVQTRTGALVGDHDVFFSRDADGAISDVIKCLLPGETPFQLCSHLIDNGDEDIKLSYAPEFLPEWRRLSQNAKMFFRCMQAD